MREESEALDPGNLSATNTEAAAQSRYTIAVLPGDGIGREVVAEAQKVLQAIGDRFGHEFVLEEALVGGAAMDATGVPLPESTLALCRAADAVLFGAVGDPKYDDPQARVRPEQALLAVRQELGLYANLRPVWVHPALADASPLRPELVQGVDLIVVRELTGGIYFGEPRIEGGERALDTMVYTRAEIERIAHLAFRTALARRRKVTSVDKANVLACSRLWRRTVEAVAQDYPDVELEHLLIDAATMHLITRPRDFDVILTANQYGDAPLRLVGRRAVRPLRALPRFGARHCRGRDRQSAGDHPQCSHAAAPFVGPGDRGPGGRRCRRRRPPGWTPDH